MNVFENNSFNCSRGLSLVEISVVLVIIGLIVAAISGSSKIKQASELRSVITDIEQFRAAIEGFDAKYRDLPGDMPDAHSYWDNGSNGICGTAAQCNGDGNGSIDLSTTANDNESYRAWQHLELGGFVDGGYTGLGGGDGDQADPGVNAPATKRPGGAYHIRTHTNDTHTMAGTNIAAGGFLANEWSAEKLFTPAEAYSIDEKMDDGIADSGKVKGRYYYNGSWQTTTCLSGAYPNRDYAKTREDVECIMFFDVEP